MRSIVQTELIGVELVEENEDFLALFHQVDWLEFLQQFQGHSHEGVKYFVAPLNGKRAYVGDLEIKINLEFVVATTQLH